MKNECVLRNAGRKALALLVCLVPVACTTHQNERYPESWPSLSQGNATKNCHDLSGIYADKGETRVFPAVAPSLTFNLGWQAWGPEEDRKQGWRKADQVTVSVLDSGSMLAVIRDVNGARIASHIFTYVSGDFECRQGHGTIRWHVSGTEDVVAGRDDYTVELSRVGEYLVAHVHDRGIGVIGLVFPVTGNNSGWVRFKQIVQ